MYTIIFFDDVFTGYKYCEHYFTYIYGIHSIKKHKPRENNIMKQTTREHTQTTIKHN